MPENTNKVEQENITAGNDVAGRDITKNDNSIHIHRGTSESQTNYFDSLYEQYQIEKTTNQEIKEIIFNLLHFKSSLDGDVQGLETKLTKGQRESLINFATASKEYFYKKLFNVEYSESAQKFYASLLAEIVTDFHSFVYPNITSLTEIQVNQKIDEFIIIPLSNKLGKNVFDVNKYEIMGMIYFLTGNCHINWA